MTTPDTLRDTRIPLNNGSGALPAVGFGTLIPDPVAARQATKTALEVGFRHFDCAERYRNEEAVGEAMQKCSRRAQFGARTCSLRQNYGTPIIVRSGSSRPLTTAAGGCKSTPSIATSSTPRSPFNPATSRTRGTNTARSSMIPG
jgi:hypothetical protein